MRRVPFEVNGTFRRLAMATREDGGQKSTSRKTEEVEEVADLDTSDVQERQAELTDNVDDILDEIDSVLEANAEDFVRGYIQKGGE
jgi:ubiquitin-like protein Pup